ncbi:MAG TPA: hypothetical protein HA326_09320 [Thermoplasmata archaeon]|nr:hypothetical protein [Thermoplasmata archaeon]
MAAPPKDARTVLKFANDHAHWSIDLADTKANVIMAAGAILAGLLINQSVPACGGGARYLLLLAVVLSLSSACAGLGTLFPRTRSAGQGSLLHFVDIDRFPDAAAYLASVQNLTPADADRELAKQTWELARIEDRKFFWLRWAFRLFGLCLTAAIIGVVWARLACG